LISGNRRWKEAKLNATSPFEKWRVYLFGRDKGKKDTYARILHAGGAEIFRKLDKVRPK
jgi:sarcosine oxidase delta subunit